MKEEEVKGSDLLSDIKFDHLDPEKANQPAKAEQLRLPTTINLLRDKSVCLSQDSHFYNKSYVRSEGSGSDKEQGIAMQLCSNEEFDQMDKEKEKIPGFSFFGKRDMIQRQSVNSEFEVRKSSPFMKANQSWVHEMSPSKLNVSN